MAKVVNNVVKMEWEQNRFLQSKESKRGAGDGVFFFACKDYVANGEIVPVFFNPYHAWVHFDEDGLFYFEDLKQHVMKTQDNTFPETAEEYHPILSVGEDFDMELIEKYGLTEYMDDIRARLQDIIPYGEEKEVGVK